MMSDKASITNIAPIIAKSISCFAATAMVPNKPPSANEPVSPMKILAGAALNHRKAMQPPMTAEINTVISPMSVRGAILNSEEMAVPAT